MKCFLSLSFPPLYPFVVSASEASGIVHCSLAWLAKSTHVATGLYDSAQPPGLPLGQLLVVSYSPQYAVENYWRSAGHKPF